MKIIHALPRGMRFEASAASSVELCVADWVDGSKYKLQTTVFAERGSKPLLDVEVYRVAPARRLKSWHLAYSIRRAIKRTHYDLIVTQQHIPTAARIAAFNRKVPVILQTHNFIDPPKRGAGGALFNAIRLHQLNALSGITLVSEATRERFEAEWPAATVARRVISNAFNFSQWHPAAERKPVVLVVGRVQENKGILEAAEGIREFLAQSPEWRGVFVLSEARRSRNYLNAIMEALTPVRGNVDVLSDVPFSLVKEITESAAICLVPSKWQEPFGRTALEAHAGGAALISSGTGGLREISGDAALYLKEVTGPEIAAALRELANNNVLRERLARDGAARVRLCFPLARGAGVLSTVIPICERLDDFYDEVLTNSVRSARQ